MISPQYVAGFLDGEGTIGLAQKKSGFVLRVSIGNTHLGVLEAIQAEYGGNIYYPKPIVGRLQMHEWRIAYKKALNFLEIVLPYLIVKRPQAELAIQIKNYQLGPGAWKGERADASRAAILNIRNRVTAMNGNSGNKMRVCTYPLIHPATITTQAGWSRRANR